MPITVFLSVGRTFTKEQEQYVKAIENFMLTHGIKTQTVGRNYFSNQQPLKSIEELMKQCSGAVILALERIHVETALEKRTSPQEKRWERINLPSVWNQIEAAIAYAFGLPLLVIVENNIKSEGLLETGYDWYVKWINIEDILFEDPEFTGLFDSWLKSVQEYNASKNNAPEFIPTEVIGTSKHLTQLRQILAERFDEDELRGLLFELDPDLDYESLPGQTRPIKAMELVKLMKRHDRLDDLIKVGQKHRPDINWM